MCVEKIVCLVMSSSNNVSFTNKCVANHQSRKGRLLCNRQQCWKSQTQFTYPRQVLFFFKDFIYLFIRERERERKRERKAETQAKGEAGSMQVPDMVLDSGSPGSHPGLKAALNC